MFDVGFTELMLIGVVALVVIGPERLPDVARTLGRWISKMQRFVRGVKSDINAELETGDLKKLIGDQKDQISELRTMVNSTRKEIESSAKNVVGNARKRLDEMEDSVKEDDVPAPDAPEAGSGIPAQKRSTPAVKTEALETDSDSAEPSKTDPAASVSPKADDSSSAAGQGS